MLLASTDNIRHVEKDAILNKMVILLLFVVFFHMWESMIGCLPIAGAAQALAYSKALH